MNETANKILVELLNRAVNGIDAAVQFSQAQIPDVIHQLLLWNFVSSIIVQVSIILAWSLYSKLGSWCFKKSNEDNWSSDRDFIMLIILVVLGIASVCLIIPFCFNFDWLKIWLAPKLYLLEYAKDLIK